MLTEKDYCDYDTCVALAELGITYCGLHFYVVGDKDTLCSNILQPMTTRTAEVLNYVLAIPLYVAQKFLREEKGIGITIFHNYYHDTREMFYMVELYNTKHWLKTFGEFTDWTQALSEGIKEAIKILKEKYDKGKD